jgi:hypothetical protein
MSLMRRRNEFVITVNGVEFLIHDGLREVACRAALELLRNRFGSNDRDRDELAFAARLKALRLSLNAVTGQAPAKSGGKRPSKNRSRPVAFAA